METSPTGIRIGLIQNPFFPQGFHWAGLATAPGHVDARENLFYSGASNYQVGRITFN